MVKGESEDSKFLLLVGKLSEERKKKDLLKDKIKEFQNYTSELEEKIN
jgi:hypothetical protein